MRIINSTFVKTCPQLLALLRRKKKRITHVVIGKKDYITTNIRAM